MEAYINKKSAGEVVDVNNIDTNIISMAFSDPLFLKALNEEDTNYLINVSSGDMGLLGEIIKLTKEKEKLMVLNELVAINQNNENKNSSRKHKVDKATRPLRKEEYYKMVQLAQEGFTYIDDNGKERRFRPNQQLALVFVLEATLGLRISDVLKLTVDDVRKGRLEVVEKKTGKLQHKEIPRNLKEVITDYALSKQISGKDKIINIQDRPIRRHIAIISKHCGYINIGSHSFRKLYATTAYEETKNLELVRRLLNHSSLGITQKYLGVSQDKIDEISRKIDFSDAFTKL